MPAERSREVMSTRTVVLLGPQRPAPDIGAALAELGVRGKVAVVMAGYQERESEDAQVMASLGVPGVNLTLHARAGDVFARDAEFRDAYHARQTRLRNIQSFYRVRLEKTDEAGRMISVRHVEDELLEQEDTVSVEQLRQLDRDHVDRCAAVRMQFEITWKPVEREHVARHKREITELLAGTDALVIAGGHLASLYNRLALFDVLELASPKPVFAWSAGAMVLTDQMVLFHDYPPYGSDIAQVLDAGFGLAPRLVVLPDPRRRVRMDDRAGIARFARRMAPATCVAMDNGTRVILQRGTVKSARVRRLAPSGLVETKWKSVPT